MQTLAEQEIDRKGRNGKPCLFLCFALVQFRANNLCRSMCTPCQPLVLCPFQQTATMSEIQGPSGGNRNSSKWVCSVSVLLLLHHSQRNWKLATASSLQIFCFLLKTLRRWMLMHMDYPEVTDSNNLSLFMKEPIKKTSWQSKTAITNKGLYTWT